MCPLRHVFCCRLHTVCGELLNGLGWVEEGASCRSAFESVCCGLRRNKTTTAVRQAIAPTYAHE